MNMQFAVIAYPPKRPRWQFWKSERPYLLKASECQVNNDTGEARIHKPKKGYAYRLVNLMDSEIVARKKRP